MIQKNQPFNYAFIEQEALHYLLSKYLPTHFKQTPENGNKKINLQSFFIERSLSKIGFISSYKDNDLICSDFLQKNNITHINGVVGILNGNFFIHIIFFIKDNMLDAIEVVSLGEVLPKTVTHLELLTAQEFDELVLSNTPKGRILKDKYG